MSDTNTGGSSVGGNVTPGHDYVGRDKHNVGDGAQYGNHVDVHTTPYQQANDSSDTEILRNLHRAILGNPYNLRNEPGLLKSVGDLADALTITEGRLTTFTLMVWVTIMAVGIEAVVLIWLVVQLSMLV